MGFWSEGVTHKEQEQTNNGLELFLFIYGIVSSVHEVVFCKHICLSKVFLKGCFTSNDSKKKQQPSIALRNKKVHKVYCTFTNRVGMALGTCGAATLFHEEEGTAWQTSGRETLCKRAEPLFITAVGSRVRSQPAPGPGRWSGRCSRRCSRSSCTPAGCPPESEIVSSKWQSKQWQRSCFYQKLLAFRVILSNSGSVLINTVVES